MTETSNAQSSNTLMAVLCYFGILVLIPLLTDAKKDSFVNFHIKQGLVLLIAYVAFWFLFPLPLIGWIASVVLFILFLTGVINAASGKEVELPVIGSFGSKIKI